MNAYTAAVQQARHLAQVLVQARQLGGQCSYVKESRDLVLAAQRDLHDIDAAIRSYPEVLPDLPPCLMEELAAAKLHALKAHRSLSSGYIYLFHYSLDCARELQATATPNSRTERVTTRLVTGMTTHVADPTSASALEGFGRLAAEVSLLVTAAATNRFAVAIVTATAWIGPKLQHDDRREEFRAELAELAAGGLPRIWQLVHAFRLMGTQLVQVLWQEWPRRI